MLVSLGYSLTCLLVFLGDIFFRKEFSLTFIVALVTTFFVILPGDPNKNNLFWTIALLGIWFTYVIEFKKNTLMAAIDIRRGTPKSIFIFAGLFCGLSFLYSISNIISLHGGIIEAFFRPRVHDYLSGGIIAGKIAPAIIYALTPFYVLLMGYFFERKKRGRFVGMWFLMICYYLLLADTRLPILFIIIVPFYLWFLGLKKKQKVASLLGIGPFALMGLLGFINYTAYLRSGVANSISATQVWSISKFTNQLGYREWVSDLISFTNVEGFSYGIDWIVNPVVTFIPRFFWPDKPITSTSNILHQNVGGHSLGDGSYILTYTIFGEGYYQLGYFGVLIAPIILLFLFKLIVRLSQDLPGSPFFIAWSYFRFIPYVRAELPIFMVFFLLVEIAIFRVLWIRRVN